MDDVIYQIANGVSDSILISHVMILVFIHRLLLFDSMLCSIGGIMRDIVWLLCIIEVNHKC